MRLPLICDDNGDMTVFATLEEAAREIEAVDVQNGEYRFFDADGYAVDAYVVGATAPRTPWFLTFLPSPHSNGFVRFRDKKPREACKEEVEEKMRCFLIRCGHGEHEHSLDSLIQIVRNKEKCEK
jgi:hypothetical protein